MRKRAPTALLPSTPSTDATLAERRPDLASEAEGYAAASLADETKRAFASDWKTWSTWCVAQGLSPLPATPDTAAGFLADQAKTKKVATLERYRATIGKLHKVQGHASPFADARVKAVLEGIRRKKGVVQVRKAPASPMLVSGTSGDTVGARRDRAILLLGWATALRGRELCSLDVGDLEWVDEGLLVHLRRSKTDQVAAGRTVAVPRVDDAPESCPARAVRAWLDDLPDEGGPLFRGLLRNGAVGGRRITRVVVNALVKKTAAEAGLDPKAFGAHSLRAGYVTEARRSGQDWSTIMAHTGHKRVETVQRYDRGTIDPFRADRVGDVFEAAFAGDTRYTSSPDEWEALASALKSGGVAFSRVGLPPPSRDAKELAFFSGGDEHQRLCSSAARWLARQGRAWTASRADCHSAGGIADVATVKGDLFVECGQTTADKVCACLRAGQSVLLVPYGFEGIVGFLLSGKMTPDPEVRKRAFAAIEKLDEAWRRR